MEFRAGKMTLEGTTVKPDMRRGFFRLIRGEEGILRFQWTNRSQNLTEDDFLVFPEEAVFEKVQQSSGRVYILKFKQDDRKYFFWMQEPNSEGDAPLCSLVNFYLNCPQEFDQDGEDQAIDSGGYSDNVQDTELSKVIVKDHPSNGAASHNVATAQGPVQLSDLQRILSTIRPLETEAEAALPRDTGPSLAEILKPELIVPLLENCHLEERLAPFLPEGPWTSETLVELMQSPQFHQQVDAFTQVLRSGQIDLAQFGIDSSKFDFTVSSFLEAIEDQVTEKSEPGSVSISEESDVQGGKVTDENSQNKGDHKSDPMEEGR